MAVNSNSRRGFLCRSKRHGRIGALSGLVVVVLLGFVPAAQAYEFSQPLRAGVTGPDVRELQVRLAGWFPRSDQKQFVISGTFDRATKTAVMAFERDAGLEPDGMADIDVFEALHHFEDRDGSTTNFDWAEFEQKSNPACSKRANRFAGSFEGGAVSVRQVKRNVQMVMWRLEALRSKAGNKPIAITSGFRGTAYNRCIGGATSSQHMYGTAADIRIVGVDNRSTRDLARTSQFSGVGCYSDLSHNHLDLRLENDALETSQFWWWPKQDEEGRDLAYDDKPCWGEGRKGATDKGELAAFTITSGEALALVAAPEAILTTNN